MSQTSVAPDAPLNIALLGYRSAPHSGGQGIYLKYLSRSLARRGHKVTVISGPPTLSSIPKSHWFVYQPDLYEHGLRSIRPIQLLSRLERIEWFSKLTGGFAEPYTFGERVKRWFVGRESEFDIIHDNQTIADGILSLQHRGLPLVTTIHHPITKDYRVALAAEPRWYMRLLIHRWHSFLRMQKRVAPQLQSVVTVSGASATDISDDFNVDRAAITVMHLGVDTELFRPLPETEREPHRLMTTASADAPLKGLAVLLRAIASLRSSYPDIRLTLVGRPKPGGDTEKLIASLGSGMWWKVAKASVTRKWSKNTRVPRLPWCPLFTRDLVCQPLRQWHAECRWYPRMEVLSLKWSRMPVWSFPRVIATHLRRRFANCLRMTSFETTTPLAAYRERSTIFVGIAVVSEWKLTTGSA